MLVKPAYLFSLVGAGLLTLLGFGPTIDGPAEDGPSPVRTPAQERASFQLEPGLTIQLVAAEPLVQDPVVMTFDPDGKLWVVEMRGYMRTIDADGEKERVGRVVVLEDTNNDGTMDVSHVYLDSLVMPRAITLVPGGGHSSPKMKPSGSRRTSTTMAKPILKP